MTEEIASYRWGADQISDLLMRLSTSTSAEVVLVIGLDRPTEAYAATAVA